MSNLWLVIGPPGTGKTTYLSDQTKAAVTKHGRVKVVIASLTRTAAAEIADRINLPDENVGTLHAHAYRALNRPDLAETPEGLKAWTEAHPHLALTGGRNQLEDASPDDTGGKTRGDQLHQQVMNHRARLINPTSWTADEQDYWQQWSDWKTKTDRLDFTDLIEQAIADTGMHPSMPKVLLLDEAQDFSALELKLAVHWARYTDTTVFAADPDQSIYAWRGASANALYELPLAGKRILERSRRVPAAVHELATRWISQIEDRQPAEYQPRLDEHGQVVAGVARRVPVSLRYPEALLPWIDEDLAQGRTVMVLTSCGYMLAPLIGELRAHGVPFHNPYRATQGAWNPMRAANRLTAYLRHNEAVWGDQARSWTWDDLRLWTDPLQARTALPRGLKAFVEDKCRPDRFGQSMADEEIPLDLLARLLDSPTLGHPCFHSDVDWWQHHLRATFRKQLTYPIDIYRRHGGPALLQKPQVTVGTIHSVKGGQADSVYVFPDLSKQGMASWHFRADGRDQIIRMFYVAVTRARTQITVLDPSGPEHIPLDHLTPQETIAA